MRRRIHVIVHVSSSSHAALAGHPRVLQPRTTNRANITNITNTTGYPPFYCDDRMQLYQTILSGKVEFPKHLKREGLNPKP